MLDHCIASEAWSVIVAFPSFATHEGIAHSFCNGSRLCAWARKKHNSRVGRWINGIMSTKVVSDQTCYVITRYDRYGQITTIDIVAEAIAIIFKCSLADWHQFKCRTSYRRLPVQSTKVFWPLPIERSAFQGVSSEVVSSARRKPGRNFHDQGDTQAQTHDQSEELSQAKYTAWNQGIACQQDRSWNKSQSTKVVSDSINLTSRRFHT
jgi:hypothetical protein